MLCKVFAITLGGFHDIGTATSRFPVLEPAEVNRRHNTTSLKENARQENRKLLGLTSSSISVSAVRQQYVVSTRLGKCSGWSRFCCSRGSPRCAQAPAGCDNSSGSEQISSRVNIVVSALCDRQKGSKKRRRCHRRRRENRGIWLWRRRE